MFTVPKNKTKNYCNKFLTIESKLILKKYGSIKEILQLQEKVLSLYH